MKICHIITTLVYGGAEKLLVNLTNIHAAHHNIHIVYFKEEPLVVSQLASNIAVHHLPLDKDIVANLKEFIQELKPDIIHTHLGHADFIGLWATRNLPVSHFCTMHNIWFKWDWRDYLFFGGYQLLLNYFVPDTQVVAISNSVAQHIKQRLKVPDNRVHTIYNAIPNVEITASKTILRQKLNIDETAFCVLFIGRLRIQKSVDTLLYAIVELKEIIPNISVQIVGEGAGYQEEELKQLSVDLGLNDIVQFRGVTINPEDYFAAADVFVLPSVFEGLGIVVLEAFRAALPVIATNIEGPQELIEDGINGLLFTPKDHQQLSQKIFLLYKDTDLRKRIGETGYHHYRDKFTIESYASKLENLYQQQLSKCQKK